jgi:ATP-dependent Clp protease ATP-binding subunit ClpC
MYERFTDRARKVMQLANQEAQRFNHEYIRTEHVLLGLIQEGSGVAANVLKNLDVDLRKIRLEVERLVQSGPNMVTRGKLPQTPRAKKVIEFSMEEARNLNHNYVGTEHILLGLLREQEGVAAQVLTNMGLSVEAVRAEIRNLVVSPPKTPAPEQLPNRVTGIYVLVALLGLSVVFGLFIYAFVRMN